MFNAGDGRAEDAGDRDRADAGRREHANNNASRRLVNVEARKPRILYIEGEPRWEFKFIRRAAGRRSRAWSLASMLRTTQNKIYRQGSERSARSWKTAFPRRRKSCSPFEGLIIGSVEANYFTPTQQELIRDFVDRRGGGLLFLGGRFALADGGYANSPLADLLPVRSAGQQGHLPSRFLRARN